MTDDEIIKALNYCCGNIKNNDEECNEDMCYQVCLPESREEGIRWCRQWLIKDTLDLINRQKDKIKEFDERNIIYRGTVEWQAKEINRQKVEIERLEKEAEDKERAYNDEFCLRKEWQSKCRELLKEKQITESEAIRKWKDVREIK